MNIIKNLFRKLSNDTITLKYYELQITDGIIGARRGEYYIITEIYVPELNITICRNEIEGTFNNNITYSINIFIPDSDRYNTSIIKSNGNIPPKLIRSRKIAKDSKLGRNIVWLSKYINLVQEKKESLNDLFN